MREERYQRFGGDLHERPLRDLFGELVREAQGLLRSEARLAKAELREEARRGAKGAAAIGAGGALLHAAVLLAGATLVLALATFLAAWLAALLVAGLFAALGWGAVARGRSELRKADPSKAVQTLKEDARWARETMRDVRSSRDADA